MRIDALYPFHPGDILQQDRRVAMPTLASACEIPCIHDLDIRRKIVDGFKDYAQILSPIRSPLRRL